jgi:hypothetical protein
MKKQLIVFLAIQILSTPQIHSQKIKTPTVTLKRNPMTKILFAGNDNPEIHYIHTDQVSAKKLQRYGEVINKIEYYKIKSRGETHYLAIYLTAENKIADMRGY